MDPGGLGNNILDRPMFRLSENSEFLFFSYIRSFLFSFSEMKRKASQQLNRSGYVVRPKYREAMGNPAPRMRRSSIGVGLAAELKYNTVPFFTDATTAGTIIDLNNFAAGDTALLRDGNKVLCKSLEIRCSIELESATFSQNVTSRWLLVHDKNANTVQPTFAQVLDALTVESQRNISGVSRFTILMDKTVVTNQTSGTAKNQAFFKKYVKIPQELQLTCYADGTAQVPVSGSLTLMYLSNVAPGATDTNITGTSRLRFIG